MAGGEGHDAQHPHASGNALVPESVRETGHGPGQGEAEHRGAVRHPDRAARPPSKALKLAEAEAVLKAAEGTSAYAYIVVALLTGARTEEMRALTWDHVFLKGDPDASPPVPPHIAVWRSVRSTGDTKTKKSRRRTIALPARCVDALWQQIEEQGWDQLATGDQWTEKGLVFSSATGTELDLTNVRRVFRLAISGAEGVDAREWTPRELRHSFVSLLSDKGVPLEEISRLVGHSGTAVTEAVYRKQIRPVIQTGATVMDGIFKEDPKP